MPKGNRLQGDSSRDHPWHFSIRKKENRLQFGKLDKTVLSINSRAIYLNFKYLTDQTMCIILEKLSNPSILTIALGAQKNRLQGDGSCEHQCHFSIRK